MPYLPYEEPGITQILPLASFLLLLNGTRYIFDRLLYCGIIGEILIGVIWGLPVGGTAWLSQGTQVAIQAFGYLGLISLVFEGGLSTDLALMRKTAYMSISVATVGLCMPIALSFILLSLPFSSSVGTAYPSPLAAFSAGASLCSTSLGTTFAILSSANLQQTRVGVVLVGAALMDDVVGLVMVNIVTTLGGGGTAGWPIARPIVASFGLLLVTLTFVAFVLKPIWAWLVASFGRGVDVSATQPNLIGTLRKTTTNLVHQIPHLNFILSTAVLVIFVTIASFIDASVLFAAFIAGGVVNSLQNITTSEDSAESTSNEMSLKMYEKYYKPAMNFILVPFFFASIGFSIPITKMFAGSIVWKGIIYSLLMIMAKGFVSSVIYFDYFMSMLRNRKPGSRHKAKDLPPNFQLQPAPDPQLRVLDREAPTRPPHLIAVLVGSAMVARGEIGFLIASLSQSSGTLTLRLQDGSDVGSLGEEIFLVIIWAVALCTITGPLGVGFLVRRLRQGNKCAAWL